jgi:hypothetical protein
MSKLKKVCFCLVPLVFAMVFPLLLSAQDQTSVTGCLKQGRDSNGYYIMGQDGKMYELVGKNLGEHVNHTVTVTGSPAKMSHAMEEKKESAEKAEAGSASVMDLKVSNLKMVSENCQ